MGCGHSKITINPKKPKLKINCKKAVLSEKVETEDEENIENECDFNEKTDDCDQKKTIKVKALGGPLLAQADISTSQQNFFKMLDERIENGPDYDSTSETERAAETSRLKALLKDWETASAGSRSLPSTPKHRLRRAEKVRTDGVRSAEITYRHDRASYATQIPRNVVHQTFGVAQYPAYRDAPYNSVYVQPNPPVAVYPSLPQYQVFNPVYNNQLPYQPSSRQYLAFNAHHNSPIKTNNPQQIPYDLNQLVNYSSPSKMYGVKAAYTNGDLIQQQMYNHQVQYQQAREYQQYKQSREQVLLQQQGYTTNRDFQSSVHAPLVMQGDSSRRSEYEAT